MDKPKSYFAEATGAKISTLVYDAEAIDAWLNSVASVDNITKAMSEAVRGGEMRKILLLFLSIIITGMIFMAGRKSAYNKLPEYWAKIIAEKPTGEEMYFEYNGTVTVGKIEYKFKLEDLK